MSYHNLLLQLTSVTQQALFFRGQEEIRFQVSQTFHCAFASLNFAYTAEATALQGSEGGGVPTLDQSMEQRGLAWCVVGVAACHFHY